MADETKTTTETTVTETTAPAVENTALSPNEDSVAQINSLKAEMERLKAANDKLSKEAAENKRQLRAKQTEEERIAQEQEEAQRKRQEEYEAILAENNRMKAFGAYALVADEKTVEKLIDAVSDADHKAIANIIADLSKKAVTDAEAKWLKERPQVRTGQYSGMTREQIMAITDSEERIKAIAMNKELFS